MYLCLLLCGDVQVHPRPNTPQLPSTGIQASSKAVSCDEWTHLKYCNQQSIEIPIEFCNECNRDDKEMAYFCRKCINNILTISNNQMPEYLGNGSNDSGVEKTSTAATSDISNNTKTHSFNEQSSDF